MAYIVKNYTFVRTKSVIRMFLTSNYRFWTNYQSIIHKDVSSSEKVHALLSSHIKIHNDICLELFWTVFGCKTVVIDRFIFLFWFRLFTFLRWLFYWRTQYYWLCILAGNNGLKLKHFNGFASYKHAAYYFSRC